MAPPKRGGSSGQKKTLAGNGSAKKKSGQALISRFFSSQSQTQSQSQRVPAKPAAAVTPPPQPAPKPATKPKPVDAPQPSTAAPVTPVKPAAPAGAHGTPTGLTPVTRRTSDGGGKRVAPTKRPRESPRGRRGNAEKEDGDVPGAEDVMDVDGSDSGDDDESGGDDAGDDDFCPEAAVGAVDLSGVDADSEDSEDSDAEEITRPKRRRKLVVDDDDDADRGRQCDNGDVELDTCADEEDDEGLYDDCGDESGDDVVGSGLEGASKLLEAYDAGSGVAAPRSDAMRKRFQRAVGRLDSNPWFMRTTGGAGGGGDDAGDDGEGGEGNASNVGAQYVFGSMAAQKAGKAKYTPLEQQYVDIKKKHPDKLLLVECGYKFQFFGEDALAASKACRIYCGVKGNFNTASVPVVALARHVSNLVAAGHKVGIVRQIDTAALKKASGKSGAFRRELCEVYTRGTLFADGALGGTTGVGSGASYIAAFQELSVFDGNGEASGTGMAAKLAVVAVDTATGDVVFDSFTDDVLRSELDARLMALEPVEVVVSKSEMSTATERTLTHYCHVSNARLDRVNDKDFSTSSGKGDHGDKVAGLRGLIEDACKASGSKIPLNDVLNCASALTTYLRQFKLERAVRGAHQFRAFAARREMRLGADVIRNFELFHNSNDGRTNGSLLSLLNRTKTPFGSRQMKHWLAHPLTDAVAIQERLDAVESLRQLVDGAYAAQGGIKGARTPDASLVELLESMSKSFPDLERGLARISYEKCTPSLFLGIVNAFDGVARIVQSLKQAREVSAEGDKTRSSVSLKSTLLTVMIDSVPDVAPSLDRYVFSRLDVEAVKDNDFRRIFKENEVTDEMVDGSCPAEQDLDRSVKELAVCLERIASCESNLDEYLVELRRKFKRPQWHWKTVANEEYMLEVPTSQAKSMPKDWEIMSTTKAQKRFRPRRVADLFQLLEQARELCDEAAAVAWKSFLVLFSSTAIDLRAVVRFLCDLDCLASHARTSLLPGYSKPELLDPACTKAGVHAKNARHPIAEALLQVPYVPNDVCLGACAEESPSSSQRCMVITGPNMGGKSSYIRMTGLLAIMTQIGCYLPAESAKVSPFDAMFCRMGARDMLGKGMSTLMCELAETSKILECATDRSLIVLDELGRGTSTHDGTAIAAATLEHIVSSTSAVVLFVTHFPSIARLADSYQVDIGSYYLDYLEEESAVDTVEGEEATVKQKKKLTFLYKVTSGVAKRSYGLNVAQLAGLPGSVIDVAARAASNFDSCSAMRNVESVFHSLLSGLGSPGADKAAVVAKAFASTSD